MNQICLLRKASGLGRNPVVRACECVCVCGLDQLDTAILSILTALATHKLPITGQWYTVKYLSRYG